MNIERLIYSGLDPAERARLALENLGLGGEVQTMEGCSLNLGVLIDGMPAYIDLAVRYESVPELEAMIKKRLQEMWGRGRLERRIEALKRIRRVIEDA